MASPRKPPPTTRVLRVYMQQTQQTHRLTPAETRRTAIELGLRHVANVNVGRVLRRAFGLELPPPLSNEETPVTDM